MKILLFVHATFLGTGDDLKSKTKKEWILGLFEQLKKEGFEPDLFDPLVHKISEYGFILAFSSQDPEIWQSLKSTGSYLIIIPDIHPESQGDLPPLQSCLEKSGTFFIRATRAFIQRRWPPLDPDHLYSLADFYFTPTEAWKKLVHTDWLVPLKNISLFPSTPEKAGQVIANHCRAASRRNRNLDTEKVVITKSGFHV